ncbi:flagellar export protein FliJ [Glaciecola sp. 1036]|uniref:flagellar export protein FliJ n=1 Tax=Alteromonadaceae TaxID=72275 RepID=UPI003D017B6A
MASIQQLQLVVDIEKKKENTLLQHYQTAKQYVFDNQRKLSGLENYRLEYLKQIKQKVNQGVGAKTLIQHQNFVAKLDKACQQQINIINQGVMAENQRKQQWLLQQKKTKAVEALIQKRRIQAQMLEQKKEQKLFDEIASQRFHRSRSSMGY